MIHTLVLFLVVVFLVACGTTSERTAPVITDASKVSYARIYCSPDNESHFETVTSELSKVDAAPPAQPFFARGSAATRVAFAAFEAGWGAQDKAAGKYHPAPAAQFVIYLSGQMSISTSDGQSRQFGAGDVLRVEDVAPCKGHTSVAGPMTVHTMVVR